MFMFRVFVLAAIALSFAPATAGGRQHDDAQERGRAIAQTNCARCHGISARDVTSPLPAAPPFRRFRERYPIEHLAEAFAEGIVVGHAEMPAFEFDPSEIEALLAYLNSIQPRR
ncbi:MAG: cytochrome c [Rhodospirillaceae bacterium]